MNQIVKVLKETKVFYVATVDGDCPRVRPFSSVCEYNNKAYICSNNTKNFWKQIEENNKIEICGMCDDGSWIRISAIAKRDCRLEVKKAMLEDPTGPSELYQAEDEIFEVLCLENAVCTKYSFTGEPIIIEE